MLMLYGIDRPWALTGYHFSLFFLDQHTRLLLPQSAQQTAQLSQLSYLALHAQCSPEKGGMNWVEACQQHMPPLTQFAYLSERVGRLDGGRKKENVKIRLRCAFKAAVFRWNPNTQLTSTDYCVTGLNIICVVTSVQFCSFFVLFFFFSLVCVSWIFLHLTDVFVVHGGMNARDPGTCHNKRILDVSLLIVAVKTVCWLCWPPLPCVSAPTPMT